MATILLVDDVALFLELERSFLEDRGYRVVTATSGEEALERLPEVMPDLVLLDLYMPGIDGDEVCRRLRATESWARVPVIMVTAAGKEQEVRQCLDAGCDDYLTKPVNKTELLEKVHRLLGGVKWRTAGRTPVSLRVQLRSEGRSLSATVRDISQNGVYVKSRTTLAAGAVVELHLELPEGRQSRIMGKVKRVREGADSGMGIYFIHPDAEGRKILERLIQSGPEDPGGDPVVPAAGSSEPRLQELEQQNRVLREEKTRLQGRVEELEGENREFAEQLVQTEDVNNNLTNLYIASSRLHAELDRTRVIAIIKEVVINFVGAEKFALLLFDKSSGELRFEAGEGFEGESFPAVECGTGILGEVVEGDGHYFTSGPVTEGSDDPLQPLAAIPLKIHDTSMGVLAIYRLFTQKERFAQVDYQLFTMLAEHAATALFAATLYEESERKRETYKGFMELLLQ